MFKSLRPGLLAAMLACAGALVLSACSSTDETPQTKSLQSIKHVFVLTLENKNYADTFGDKPVIPYLATTLASQGALLRQYYGTTHVSLGNYVAMLSGQSITADTQNDCQVYKDFVLTGTSDHGQAIGSGCVYPASVKTLADQLKDAKLTWKGYMEDMGNDPTRESATCGHVALNSQDVTQGPIGPSDAVPLGDSYVARHNPFVYFHSIIDSPDCDANVVNLSKLENDLKSASTTANFNFITPSACSDAHDDTCADGKTKGVDAANAFLQKWVPIITSSEAFKKDGLLIINFDEGGTSSAALDVATGTLTTTQAGETCCNQQTGPNVTKYPLSQSFQLPAEYQAVYHAKVLNMVVTSYGGDRVGAVLISPFIKAGTVSDVPYNHYSMLRSLEDILVGGKYLGYAGQEGLVSFGKDIFNF